MAIFTPYTQPQKGAQWQEPIPLEYLYKGAVENKAKVENTIQGFQQELDYLHNLPTLPGADTEVKNQILTNAFNELKNVAVEDISNPRNTSRIHSLISSVTNNPDFQNVVQRGYKVQNLQKKYDEMTKNGEFVPEWNMAPLKKAQDYINQGKYIRNYDLSGDIYKSADINKEIGDIIKNVGEEGVIDINKYGHDIVYKEKNKDKLTSAITNLMSPETKAEFERKFDYEFQGQDLHTLRQQEFANEYNRNLNLAADFYNKGDKTQGDYWMNLANSAKDAIETETPEQSRQYFINKKLLDYADKVANASAYKQIQSTTNNLAYESAITLSREKEIAKFKQQLETGEIPGVKGKLGDLDKAIYTAVINSGKPVYDNNGQLIPAKDLAAQNNIAYNPQESRDNLTSTAQKTKKITLDGKLVDKETIINDLNLGNLQRVEQVLKAYPDRFSTSDGIDPGTIKIEDGLVKWEDDDYLYDDNRQVPLDELVDFVKNISEDNPVNEQIQPSVNSSQTNNDLKPATPEDYSYKAALGNDTIYTKNGTDWYYSNGKKVE